jgi:hypothetical protein
VVTMSPITVTLSGPATYVPGSTVSLSVSVDPALSGNGAVWYLPEGGTWTNLKTVSIVDGAGSATLTPSGVRSYRVVFQGATSNVVTVSPATTVTLSGPATYVPGSTVSLAVSVSPALSGNGAVWYLPASGTWTNLKTVSIVDGVGSVTLTPSGIRSYRVVFQGATSNVVTVSPAAAEIPATTVTLSGPATYAPGSTVSLAVSVDPAASGTGAVWYLPEGGTWTNLKTVSIVDGAGSVTLTPSGVFDGSTSNEVTVTPS